MDYYFDESGNWAGHEKHRLLIGGLLLQDPASEKKLARELKILRAERKISSLHANELKEEDKELCYQLIANTLQQEKNRVLIRLFPPAILRSRTTQSYDDIYADCAAGVINTLTFGDREITIHYDMKFHYAYPVNILRKLNHQPPGYFTLIKKHFVLSDKDLPQIRNSIQKNIERTLRNRHPPQNERQILNKFLKQINPLSAIDCLDPKTASQIEKERQRIRRAISSYLWSEFWLQVESNEQVRELFRNRILTRCEVTQSLLGATVAPPKLRINFLGKHNANAGVTAIDFICNLVYRYGSQAPENASRAVKRIFSRITVEDCQS
jgi:hypothetical protein